ncbi:MAG: hypothetical protein HQL56_09435, partial [Magnetococcales bacterium]|nr:hypothetical protein [Magnetococcales bacterium]
MPKPLPREILLPWTNFAMEMVESVYPKTIGRPDGKPLQLSSRRFTSSLTRSHASLENLHRYTPLLAFKHINRNVRFAAIMSSDLFASRPVKRSGPDHLDLVNKYAASLAIDLGWALTYTKVVCGREMAPTIMLNGIKRLTMHPLYNEIGPPQKTAASILALPCGSR